MGPVRRKRGGRPGGNRARGKKAQASPAGWLRCHACGTEFVATPGSEILSVCPACLAKAGVNVRNTPQNKVRNNTARITAKAAPQGGGTLVGFRLHGIGPGPSYVDFEGNTTTNANVGVEFSGELEVQDKDTVIE